MKYDYGVTVYCPTYNHEKYIGRCLQGFVEQKTNFPVQIIVHDDASTDKTADIVREYENNYPELFQNVYQSVNQMSKGVDIKKVYIAHLIKGKYFATCDGDDYWTDPNKLQRQYDALEKNQECYCSVHTVELVDEAGNKTGLLQGNTYNDEKILDSNSFLDDILRYYAYQTSSYFFRTPNFLDLIYNPPHFSKILLCGDDKYMLYFGQLGSVYYFPEAMSCYRTLSDNSFTSNYIKASKQYRINFAQTYINALNEFDKYTQYKHHESCIYAVKTYGLEVDINSNNIKRVFSREYKDIAPLKNRIGTYFFVNFPNAAKIIKPALKKVVNLVTLKR